MDVSKWHPDKVMQLPDHFFGKRWIVGIHAYPVTAAFSYFISTEALPEFAVLWSLHVSTTIPLTGPTFRVELRLAHKVPTSQAQMRNQDKLLPGTGPQTSLADFTPAASQAVSLPYIRKLINSKGRRVVCSVWNNTGETAYLRVFLVFSSLPKEIPDELLAPRVDHIEKRLDEIWKRIKL